jgi:MbtH protein
MPQEDKEDTRVYVAVMNHEEQYSIWLADRQLPLGWRNAGKKGTKQECLDYIKTVWTDMRPLSLRKKIEALGRTCPPPTVDPNQPVATQELNNGAR